MAEYPNPNDPRNWPSPQAMIAYIYERAKAAGLDPDKTVEIARRESKNFTSFVGDQGKSGGPFQLFTGGGLGNLFETLFGGTPLDPRTVWDQINFAVDQLAAGQWQQWTTAKNANIDPRVPGGGGNPLQSLLQYVFPVQGYTGKIELHHGDNGGASDLFAPEGTSVFAMRGGTVTGRGTDDRLGGNWWMIRGTDGLDYYYAHLKDMVGLNVGDHVDTGQTLGSVGDTGNAKGTGAHLHIGIGHGINSGSGSAGGAGINFDAVGLLRQVYGFVGSAWADPFGTAAAAIGAVGSAASYLNPANIGASIAQAIQNGVVNALHPIWQTVANWFEDRSSALIFLGIAGVFLLIGLARIARDNTEVVVKQVEPMVTKAATAAAAAA